MRNIGIITQDDVFYLPDTLKRLLESEEFSKNLRCVALLPHSSSGKPQTSLQKIYDVYARFGLRFLIFYLYQYAYHKLLKRNTISSICDECSIKLWEIEGNINSAQNLQHMKSLELDVLISIGSNQIFRKDLIEIPTKGILNLHTGALPKYRGLMPTFWALHNKEKSIGVSVFLVDEGIDSGPIYAQTILPIEGLSQRQVIMKTKNEGVALIHEAIRNLLSGAVPTPNNDQDATYYKYPQKADVEKFLQNGARFF